METDWDHETPYQLLQIVNTHTCTCIGTYSIVGNFGYRILIWQYGNSCKKNHQITCRFIPMVAKHSDG